MAPKAPRFFFGFYRLKTFFHKFSKNGIAKCAQHRFCEGARPTDEIYVTESGESDALALTMVRGTEIR